MASERVDEQEMLMRLFASYSPAEVVLRYADMQNPQPPQAAEQEDFDAAIGFVDVSGFTALSEKLNKDHGRKGAELLNQCARPAHRPEPKCPACVRRRGANLFGVWMRVWVRMDAVRLTAVCGV